LTLDEVKDHLRLMPGDTLQDDYLTRLLKAARQKVEDMTNRKFVTQTWNLNLTGWPSDDHIDLPVAPIQSVPSTGITYKMTTGNSTTFSSTNWDADTVAEPGQVILRSEASWPSATLYRTNPITIRFTAGYTTASKVPEPLRQATLLLISHYYEFREPVITGQGGFIVTDVPRSVDALLSDYRLWSF